jgi:hypothetical protein
MKRNLQATAKAFQAEGKVSSDPVGMCLSCFLQHLSFLFFVCKDYCLLSRLCFLAAIDAPGGFLFEWWSVFWDIFIARTNEKHSDVAASYIEVSVYNICLSFYGKTLNGQRHVNLVTSCVHSAAPLFIFCFAFFK